MADQHQEQDELIYGSRGYLFDALELIAARSPVAKERVLALLREQSARYDQADYNHFAVIALEDPAAELDESERAAIGSLIRPLRTRRSADFDLRLSPTERRVLESGAALRGMNLSEYIWTILFPSGDLSERL